MSPAVSITGGSGFLGQTLRPGLARRGWDVSVFDRHRGALVDMLRRRHRVSPQSASQLRIARAIRVAQARAEPLLVRAGAIRLQDDDILSGRERIAERFAGCDAVIHGAGIPHPHAPGATAADFVRLNYEASVEVFEAARLAQVAVFVFVSSAQVYRINAPVHIERLPIPESSHLPLISEGQSTYGFLKGAFERYLRGACQEGPTRALSLRLEFPGFRSTSPVNLYVSTSIENLVDGFACALRAPDDLRFGAFNIVDGHVDPEIVDIRAYARRRWPHVPSSLGENQCMLSTQRAQQILGYRPRPAGTYVNEALVW